MRQQLYYAVEVRDKEGKLLKRIRHEARSFVRQWNDIVYVQVAFQSDYNMTDEDGTTRAIDRNAGNPRTDAGVAEDRYGIVVGTGSTAVSISDYQLATKCDEGVGADEFNYQAVTYTAPSVSGSDCSFTITRTAINNSGSTITVTEIGLQVAGYYDANIAGFLAVRDVLASSIDIPNGGSITVVYTIKVTV